MTCLDSLVTDSFHQGESPLDRAGGLNRKTFVTSGSFLLEALAYKANIINLTINLTINL